MTRLIDPSRNNAITYVEFQTIERYQVLFELIFIIIFTVNLSFFLLSNWHAAAIILSSHVIVTLINIYSYIDSSIYALSGLC